MPYPYYDLVQTAHADLVAEGLIAPRTNQDAVEQDKGLLTRRAAWYVNQQRNPAHGLLAKTSGNHSQGYSVDWILQSSDGDGWDIATDDGVNALPLNGDAHGPDPARIPDWRAPTAALAQVSDPPPPEPEPVPPAATEEILAAIAASEARIIAASDAGDQRTLDRLNAIIDEAEETLRQILVAFLLLKRRQNASVPPPEEDEPSRALLLKAIQALQAPDPASLKKGR